MRLMNPSAIVKIEISSQPGLQSVPVLVGPQVLMLGRFLVETHPRAVG
jgi:hypothetical protein